MNEFEYLRQMRSLRQPVAPRRDLWADIATRLDETHTGAPQAMAANSPDAPARARKYPRHRLLLIAASIAAIVVLAGGIGLRLSMAPGTDAAPLAATPRWQANDPRLKGASVELDAARMELGQAMQQSPDTAALHRLLIRTERQQDRLRHFEQQAG
jgi:anti-sigma-K factor RskA